MNWKAHLKYEPESDTVRMNLHAAVDGGAIIVLDDGTEHRIFNATEALALPEGRCAGLRIPEDAVGPLFVALAKYVGAVEHPQQLRSDYEHERGRVDKLIDAFLATQTPSLRELVDRTRQ